MCGYFRFTVIIVAAIVGCNLTRWIPRAAGQVAIQPAFVEVKLDGGRVSGQFLVTNITEQEQRYRINARYFSYTREGAVVFPGDDNARSMALWIRFNPAEFVIPPKASRSVRYVILPRGVPQPGEYWAAMSLDQLNVRGTQLDAGQGRTLNLVVSTALLVPIFGQSGEIRYEVELADLQVGSTVDGPVIQTVVRNGGTGRVVVMGKYRFLNDTGETVAEGRVGHSYVMAGAERLFAEVVAPAPPAGHYTVEVSYKTDRLSELLTRQVVFEWAPPPPPPTPIETGSDEGSTDQSVADSQAKR